MSAPYYLRLDRARDLVVIESEYLAGEHTAPNFSDAEILAQRLLNGVTVELRPPSPVVMVTDKTD